MVDTPHQNLHLWAELPGLENILDADGDIIAPEMEHNIWTLSPEERRTVPSSTIPSIMWSLPTNSDLNIGDSDGDSDEADDVLSDVEGTMIHLDIDSSAQIELGPLADGNLDNATMLPGNGSPNLHSSADAQESTQYALESMANTDPVTHESLSSEKETVEKTDRTARKPTMLELGALSKNSPRKYVPSPLSQTPMIADADETESIHPKAPVESTPQQNTVTDEGTQIRQPGEGLLDPDATSRSDNSHKGPVEQHRKSVKSHQEIVEIEEVDTAMDSIEGNAISYTVPFRHQIPPSTKSHGKSASKIMKGWFGKRNNREKSAGDQPLPPCDGEVPREPKQTSDASTPSRKRRASSTLSRTSKRSRSSPDSVKVSGRRLPLLFTLATPSSGVEHRHVVIPLPISWPKFLCMAVEAFARESCGQEIPTEVSDQAKYVMKWNKPVTHAHGDTFPKKTELCGENINAVLQWMLYSGSYDFCEIHDTQTAECIVKDEANSVMSENRPREQGSGGNMVVSGTIALGSKGNHETASSVPNSGQEGKDQVKQILNHW